MPSLSLEHSIVDERYEVRKRLNQGSYAEIYHAFDLANGRFPVIIKALNTSLQGTPEADLERTLIDNFQNEALALDTVRHPNVVQRLGHGTAADLAGVPFHYLVLEYLDGGDLLAFCRNEPLSLERAIYYFRQIAEALSEAHSRGIIHRDIKPNNLLLNADHSTIKITDFGVAKITSGAADAEITRVGTDMYAPPEHNPLVAATGEFEMLTPSADVYSLAKTIYTALIGRGPREFARRPIESLPPALASEPWGPRLCEILRRATTTRVADRYPSVKAFWADFSSLATFLAEADEDSTLATRSARLRQSAPLPAAAPTPDFEPHLIEAVKHGDRAPRIVVELPKKAPKPPAPAPAPPPAPIIATPPAPGPLIKTPPAPPARQQKENDYSYMEDLRGLVGTGWRLRAFIAALMLVLVASVAGIFMEVRRYVLANRMPVGTIVSTTTSRLRDRPAMDATEIGRLPKGTTVRILSKDAQGEWFEVEVIELSGPTDTEQPNRGWVSSKNVRVGD